MKDKSNRMLLERVRKEGKTNGHHFNGTCRKAEYDHEAGGDRSRLTSKQRPRVRGH